MGGQKIAFSGQINDTALLQKIDDLFEYRMFPLLLENIDSDPTSKQKFYNCLIDLQEAIYRLDAHLEGHWEIDHNERKNLWQNIVQSIKKCIPADIHPYAFLHHIEKYEKHEIEIRSGKLPTRFQMSYFYFYKSCDVKLLRNLIYRYGSLEKKMGNLSQWRNFDFITEINDDISDIHEDMFCFNGNRFLMQILLFGKKETHHTYDSFLDRIISNVQQKLDNSKVDSFDYQIALYAQLQGQKTKQLLYETLESVDTDILKKQSRLSKYIF